MKTRSEKFDDGVRKNARREDSAKIRYIVRIRIGRKRQDKTYKAGKTEILPCGKTIGDSRGGGG